MLQITNLTTPYLQEINLNVKAGEIIGITGDNGSGKSTLGKVIAGYYQSTSGNINLPPQQIGLLTQNPYLQFIGNTVFDELTYSLEQSQCSRDVFDKVLSNCPLDLDKSLEQLSGGEAQRLLIYKELYNSKQILILDETLSNLDQKSKDQIIEELKASGKGVILITNNINDTKYANRIYNLENGSLQQVYKPIGNEQLLDNNNKVSFEYCGYQFKTGLNLVTGSSAGGKTTLITNLCMESTEPISLIPQYPFEIVTTLDARHLRTSEWGAKINIDNDKFSQNITELSTGELVKVLIVEAVESGNPTIVLDEAIEVLDRKSQSLVLDLLSEKFETIIIVTHNQYLFNHRAVNIVEVGYETNNN